MLDTDIQELASLTTRDGDLENFERLFSKLKEMKGTVLGGEVLSCSTPSCCSKAWNPAESWESCTNPYSSA